MDTEYDKALLYLTTYGGDAKVAYRICRYLQKRYASFSVYIHTFCKSAGTLLALGADEIIMSDFAEMGPLDVQLLKIDEVGEMSSGLTINQALSSLQNEAFNMFETYFLDLRFRSGLQISTKSASEIATKITIGLFSPIYSQIDPVRLGEIDRAVRIAIEYGSRIGKRNLKDGTLEKLVIGYPDHTFVIDRTEARNLFENIRQPSELELCLANFLQPLTNNFLNDKKALVINLTEDYIINEADKHAEEKDNEGCRNTEKCKKSSETKQPENGSNNEIKKPDFTEKKLSAKGDQCSATKNSNRNRAQKYGAVTDIKTIK